MSGNVRKGRGSEPMAGREKLLGRKHPDTLTSVSNLALVLKDQG